MAFQYAAKFICGPSEGTVLARGYYLTAVNVHNPTREEIEFSKKFAIAWPGQRPGAVVDDAPPTRLGSDQALEIDCQEIRARTQLTGFVKGFVIIESNFELDVVAVYTAARTIGQPIQTLHMERVPPRRR
jgi:hypothetical protein